jgi:hypothetical protein
METARMMNKLAKALEIQSKMPEILSTERKKWESEYRRKQQFGGTPGSPGSTRGGGGQVDQSVQSLAAAMRSMARR